MIHGRDFLALEVPCRAGFATGSGLNGRAGKAASAGENVAAVYDRRGFGAPSASGQIHSGRSAWVFAARELRPHGSKIRIRIKITRGGNVAKIDIGRRARA